MSDSDSKVIGVVLLIRHGDRLGEFKLPSFRDGSILSDVIVTTEFWQDPTSYTTSNTSLTPLGNQQEFQLGGQLRQLYLNSSSPSYIDGMNSSFVNDAQLLVLADAGDEGGVIMNSAMSLLQGLFPANPNYTTTLANGTTIEAPLGGYQYIPIQSVEPTNDITLEGWTDCNTFTTANNVFYNSTEFQQMAAEYSDFLSLLPPYLDGRPVTLENMWNIYDFMNVQYIHNAAYAQALPAGYLETARYLANWHEYNIFSSPELTGIGNIGGMTIIPSILGGFADILDDTNPIKLVYHAISYKPFISLFNMTQVAEAAPELAGIVNYAAAVALEARQPASGEPTLRFNFMNGTGTNWTTYNVLGSSTDVLLSDYVNYLQPLGISSLNDWCSVCENNEDRGCAALALAASTAVADSRPKISPVGAGFLGAGLMLAVAIIMFIMLFFLGCLTFGAGRSKRTRSTKRSDSEEKA